MNRVRRGENLKPIWRLPMSDLQTQSSPPRNPSSENPDDALQRLHKMSRTAGLGSGDYAAVNGIAVAAVLFGVASALVVFDPVFLLIPVIAIVLAIVGMVQIRRSAGTQTGKGLCITAIVLAIACTAFLGSRQLLAYLDVQRNKGEVAALAEALGKDLAAQNYDGAYAHFSDDFRNRVPKDEFSGKFQQIEGFFNGRIQGMRWNERIVFDTDQKTNEQLASTLVIIDVPGERDPREEMRFRKSAGKWTIDDLPFAFPKPVQMVPGPGKAGPIAPPR